jgi:uncharacterized protein
VPDSEYSATNYPRPDGETSAVHSGLVADSGMITPVWHGCGVIIRGGGIDWQEIVRRTVRMDSQTKTKTAAPFWESKSLDEMTASEWEQLCDGCGRCCLLKLEDEDTGEIYQTRLACKMLDLGKCQCREYKRRHELVDDCLSISPETVAELPWLPESCAYKRLAKGRGLAWWHPLVSGDPETVHKAGISVRGWARLETQATVDELETYIIDDFEDE